MIKQEKGFTLVELMITMVVFVLVMAAASQVFTGLLTQFKQQSKISETNIEGVIGLDVMRRDIEHAGYGLPWEWTHTAATHTEALEFADTPHLEVTYNETGNNSVPRAIVSGDGHGDSVGPSINDTDILVVKSVNVTTTASGTSSKWTHLFSDGKATEWAPGTEKLNTDDRVIVMESGTRRLVLKDPSDGTTFTTRYAENGTADAASDPRDDVLVDTEFTPTDNTEIRVVYGVAGPHTSDVTTPLRMPFNRADYYVRTPGTMPSRCAVGTGILYKSTITQPTSASVTGGGMNEMPLLDCVADMQVVYQLDTDGDGVINSSTGDISGLSAANIRDQLKRIDVYILAHEGQRDPNFTFTNFTGANANEMRVGQSDVLGRDLDISVITNYLNYRWKLYRLAVNPMNLR